MINLLALAAPYQRDALFDAIHDLSPAPDDVLRDAVIAGDRETLDRWRTSVVDGWMLSEWCLEPGDKKTDPHQAPVPPMSNDTPRDPTGWGPQ
jgi:hypothetical protein